MAIKSITSGKVIAEWSQGSCRVKINDGALVAQSKDDPKVQAILGRIAQIGYIVAEEAHAAGREI